MPRPSVREHIVEAALTEFHRRGFTACSVEDITKAAGVPKGSFYNHFKSKDELAAEVVGRYTTDAEWNTVPAGDLSPLRFLRARFEKMAEVQAGYDYGRGCLINNMGAELGTRSEVIANQVAAGLAGWSESIAESLRAAQAAGELDASRDAERLSRFLLDAWEGALVRAKVRRTGEPLAEFFEVVFDDLLRR